MSNLLSERVVGVRHWTDRLFSFRATRNPSFRFESGQFTMVGLEVEGKPLLRAYSLAGSNAADELEFFSIKVPEGPLTSRLQHIKEGDSILVGRKATGTLVLSNLKPGRNLYLLGTGTGLAPYLSLVRDPETYERFERVVVVHGVRWIKDLAYGEYLASEIATDELVGEIARERMIYYPTVTREPFRNTGRISKLIESGKLFADVGLPAWNSKEDRVMLCGSPAMLADLRALSSTGGFEEGAGNRPGSFVVEKAFVEG